MDETACRLALVLAADGSASVGYDEFGLIAGGLAHALRDPDVAAALVAARAWLAVLLFSGRDAQDVVIDWTPLADARAVARAADAVEAMPRVLRPGLTALAEAIAAAGALFDRLPQPAARRVLDLAGDGSANDGADPAAARDRLVAAGITINGLCVIHEEPDLVGYFERTVIGGQGAFALACADYRAFAEAQRRKLLRELLVS